MTRTAELIGVSQPAVSNMIVALEHKVGFQLFIRKAGRLVPTPEGKLFYVQASRALEGFENAIRLAEEISQGKRGHLAIAAYPSISISLLPRILSLFAEQRPELHIKIISRNSQTVRDLISTQQFDMAIAELPLDYPAASMETFPYLCECMLPPDHPLTAKSVISPADLDGVPFVTLFRGDPVYQKLAAAFSHYESRWNIVAETEFFSSACELVAAGVGVGVVDPGGVLLDDRAGVQLGGHVVAGGPDQLDSPIEGLVVGTGPGERGQEAVVDVDDAPGVPLAEVGRDDLHEPGQHHHVTPGTVEE